jgi:hypothetical protein
MATIGLVSGIVISPLHAQQTTIQTFIPTGQGAGGTSAMGFSSFYGAWISLGQTFTAPGSYQILTDFSFWFGNDPNIPGPANVFAYLVSLTSAGTVNKVLYKSAATPPPPVNPATQVTFQTPGISLNPNTVYLAFLTAYNPNVTSPNLTHMWSGPASFAGGSLVSVFDDPLQGSWVASGGSGYHLAFSGEPDRGGRDARTSFVTTDRNRSHWNCLYIAATTESERLKREWAGKAPTRGPTTIAPRGRKGLVCLSFQGSMKTVG